MNSGYDVPESPMQKLARISMDQYTQQMFTEADASFAGTTSFYLVDPPYPVIASSMSTTSLTLEDRDKKPSSSSTSSHNISCNSLNETAEYDDHDDIAAESVSSSNANKRRKKNSSSPSSVQDKQQPLPMFLTKTFHMVGRCDSDVAAWSEDGNSFMIKNVEKFASTVLPQYFKHSNFSSFARQLNFYGFRKLKAEPILTADYDSRTVNHMRFFHEQFQKDKPELLHNIKRATKSDVQSKDDVYSLRVDVQNLNDTIVNMNAEFDLKLAQVTMEFNRKLSQLAGLYEQLRNILVQQQRQQGSLLPQQQGPLSGSLQQQQYNNVLQPTNRMTSIIAPIPTSSSTHAFSAMQSLHQACMTLQSPAGPQPHNGMISGNMGMIKSTSRQDFNGTEGVISTSAFTALEEGGIQSQSGDLRVDDFQLPPPRVP